MKYTSNEQPMVINHRRSIGWGLPSTEERPSFYEEAVEDAISKLKLTDYQADLLRYYADCKQGFAPALATIENATGIKKRQITQTRKELSEKGLICLEHKLLHVCWDRIISIALMEDKYLSTTKKSKFAGNTLPEVKSDEEMNMAVKALYGKTNDYLEWLASLPKQAQKEQLDVLIAEQKRERIEQIIQNAYGKSVH